jgi:hypothetical protein
MPPRKRKNTARKTGKPRGRPPGPAKREADIDLVHFSAPTEPLGND